MSRYVIPIWSVLVLLSGPAMAGHCDTEIIEAQAALNQAYQIGANVHDAVSALLDSAAAACSQEEMYLATAEIDSPMQEPDYVSVGQSMLINVTQLISGQ
ncbi:hypothetical protein [Pseudomonas sp.]|uniref:hypothetical protein n=1 Tax=Pseudomonas sp. TaxID=306 RepID=UPI002B85FB45|nr:hypothetical protein [Pseudomonas sp.]HUE93317.1 hypothetical protein [Pseudomonas sp.]